MTDTVNRDQGIDDAEVKRLIRPIVSLVSGEANHTDSEQDVKQKVSRRLDYIRAHAREILDASKTTFTDKDGSGSKSIFDILEGAFGSNVAGWSLVGKQSEIVREFIDTILAKMQAGISHEIPKAANESNIKIEA